MKQQVEEALSLDVLVGSFGADLVLGCFMHSGASVLEVRPFNFEGPPDGWTAYYEALFRLDDQVHHYSVRTTSPGLSWPVRRVPHLPVAASVELS